VAERSELIDLAEYATWLVEAEADSNASTKISLITEADSSILNERLQLTGLLDDPPGSVVADADKEAFATALRPITPEVTAVTGRSAFIDLFEEQVPLADTEIVSDESADMKLVTAAVAVAVASSCAVRF
jgi:hypothetical protein